MTKKLLLYAQVVLKAVLIRKLVNRFKQGKNKSMIRLRSWVVGAIILANDFSIVWYCIYWSMVFFTETAWGRGQS